MIRVEHLYKTYPGPYHALRGISFQAPAGVVTYLLGKSGAGKSTLLNILSGSMIPSSGKFFFCDQNILSMSRQEKLIWRRQIGMVFQDFRLLSRCTLLENIMLPLIIRSYPEKKAREYVMKVAQSFEISDILERYPHQVSGGQQQRAAIARAVIHDPLFIMADEPTGSLDPSNSRVVFHALHNLAAQGKCVLVATHNHEMIRSFSNYRLIRIDNGQVTQSIHFPQDANNESEVLV